jgi:hypothetical protein
MGIEWNMQLAHEVAQVRLEALQLRGRRLVGRQPEVGWSGRRDEWLRDRLIHMGVAMAVSSPRMSRAPKGPKLSGSLLPSRRLSEGSGAAHPVVVARSPITQNAGGSGGSLLHVSVSMSARLHAMEALPSVPYSGGRFEEGAGTGPFQHIILIPPTAAAAPP